jgi:hypothetical protein
MRAEKIHYSVHDALVNAGLAANGRPVGRGGNLAEVRERFAEHPSGLFADLMILRISDLCRE